MKTSLILAGFLVVACAGQAARATVMVQLDLRQLVGRADVIFVGTVLKTHSHWTEDRRHIVTDTTFQVGQPLRGSTTGKTVVVRNLGGAVGEIGMRVSGAPSFNQGARVVLFTEQRGPDRFVVGMRQGVYEVASDSAGRATVRADLSGLALARKGPDGSIKLVRRPATTPLPLGDFVARIKQTIATCDTEADRCRRP